VSYESLVLFDIACFMMKKMDFPSLALLNTISHFPKIAAIDLGTNSCRLVIALVDITSLHRNFFKGKLEQYNNNMRVIDSFAKIVGLGELIKQTGVLSKDAIERTVSALYICKKKLEQNYISKMRAVATEACRQAKNSHVLLEKVKEETEIELEIIPPKEEARLVLKGCSGVISEKKKYGILLDIGGGSTEVVWLRVNGTESNKLISVIDSMSLPYGIVTLNDTYSHNNSDPTVYSIAQQSISQLMQFFMAKNRIKSLLKKDMVQIITSSGTVTTFGSLVLGMKYYHRNFVDGKEFKSENIIDVGKDLLARYLLNSSNNVLAKGETGGLSGYVEQLNMKDLKYFTHYRMGLLASGAVIINSVLDSIGSCAIKIADRGVREGILYDIVDEIKNEQSVSWEKDWKRKKNY
jgi:exopolyphosphatase/guanosine-5'-triphosphate,3'-diphosphate pyrophosphatase